MQPRPFYQDSAAESVPETTFRETKTQAKLFIFSEEKWSIAVIMWMISFCLCFLNCCLLATAKHIKVD